MAVRWRERPAREVGRHGLPGVSCAFDRRARHVRSGGRMRWLSGRHAPRRGDKAAFEVVPAEARREVVCAGRGAPEVHARRHAGRRRDGRRLEGPPHDGRRHARCGDAAGGVHRLAHVARRRAGGRRGPDMGARRRGRRHGRARGGVVVPRVRQGMPAGGRRRHPGGAFRGGRVRGAERRGEVGGAGHQGAALRRRLHDSRGDGGLRLCRSVLPPGLDDRDRAQGDRGERGMERGLGRGDAAAQGRELLRPARLQPRRGHAEPRQRRLGLHDRSRRRRRDDALGECAVAGGRERLRQARRRRPPGYCSRP